MKKFFRGLKVDCKFLHTKICRILQGVENVYTRHKPLLVDILDSLAKGKLRENLYPFSGESTPDRPQDVIVFIVGGATFAEALAVAQANSTNQGMRIILGSNTIINSER